MLRVDATPDPGRRYTAIILDDSGSMGRDIEPAKQAVLDALGAMQPTDRVAVIGLNSKLILDFTEVAEARAPLTRALRQVFSDGPTPLTGAVQTARVLLEAEAAQARAFGIYQMIITTDGDADDGASLTEAIEDLARATPIQIATIGIGIGSNHVLRRDDLGRFVDVSDVQGLQDALQTAIAESADFEAITDFEGSN
jgi:Mg-chelatase subunit ChlD